MSTDVRKMARERQGKGRSACGSIKKSTLALMAMVSLLALILRYPQGHEAGVDSFDMHAIAGLIVNTGSMRWLVHPLSYVGLAPFSYSPAVPVTVASFSELSGMNLEATILLYSLFLGVLVPWTTFLLGRAALRRDSSAVFFAFLVASAEGIVGFTDWTLSTRGTFLVLVPLALAFLVKGSVSSGSWKSSWLPLSLVLGLLVFVHALWILLIPLIFASWILYRIALTQDSLLIHNMDATRRGRTILVTFGIVGGLFLIFMEYGPTQVRILADIPTLQGSLLPDNIVTRLAVHFATIMGLGVALIPLGLYRMTRVNERSRRYLLIAIALAFLPSALDPVYGVLLAIPVALMLASYGLFPGGTHTGRKGNGHPVSRGGVALIVGALIVSVPTLVTIPRSSGIGCNQPWVVDEATYNLALYVRHVQGGNFSFAWDDRVEASRIEAIAGVPALEPMLAVGTLGLPWLDGKMTPRLSPVKDLVNSLVTDQQLLSAQEWLSLAGTGYDYYWGKHQYVLLQNQPQSAAARQILDFYQTNYAIQRCDGQRTPFFDGLTGSGYTVYADVTQRVYLIPS